MAVTPTTLFRGAATTSVGTTLYTVPASTTAIVSSIIVTNTAGSAGTFTLALNGTAIATTVAIAANSIVTLDVKQPLVATNTITGGASATSINFSIGGVQIV
jgi:hypothetical protein